MKKYPEIAYDFRPNSYAEPTDPLTAILKNVKGENRRQMIKYYWSEGRLEELDPNLLRDELDSASRKKLGQIHPSFLGGEFLPRYLAEEVEIARICLLSVTNDVVSFRAQPDEHGISLRVEDEYQTKFILRRRRLRGP